MVDMKGDMGGAAAVIGAMDGIGALQPHCNVIGVIPTCENMCDGNAYRPGDVLKTFSGKTIEVAHTDAEGRVILADGIGYAKRKGATKLVDIATLTGAIVISLGHETTGLMTNAEEWGKEVKQASRIAGEKVWELPMYEEYKEYIKSDIADIKNSGGPAGGSITAGLFLKEFADDLPWVHLDIAGTSEAPKDKGIHKKGPTGIITRTLIQLAMRSG
jgi:leucyl aminopeptidase